MKYIADLHIHSPYSRATSKASTLSGLYAWALVKGINLIATGDFTHPEWRANLKENLICAEDGFFRLKNEWVTPAIESVFPKLIPVRFMLSAEISCIYKKGDRVRKVHNLIYVEDFEAADKISKRLSQIGNVHSDGRPILGLDSKDLLEIVLENSKHGFLIPAHIWTPWFSLFGSKSGFDAVEECFEELSDHIFALETGLSSDPTMNRMISSLDRFRLISNSDSHSPSKLGREANLFDTSFNFQALRSALENPEDQGFKGTLEFFSEEGKYFLSGHRKCSYSHDPRIDNTDKKCPVCSKPITLGVMSRIMDLADRKQPPQELLPAFINLIPLPEVLGEIFRVGPYTKTVLKHYGALISIFGSELELMCNADSEQISSLYSPIIAMAIERMRQGQVIKQPGYDGDYGKIRLFENHELVAMADQIDKLQGRKRRKKTG